MLGQHMAGGTTSHVESHLGGYIQTSAAGQDLSQRSVNRQMADFGIQG